MGGTDVAIRDGLEADEEASADTAVSVVMYPDYRESNPYQRMLEDRLADSNVDVEFAGTHRYAPLLCAIFEYGKPDVFHVHWLSSLAVADSSLVSAVLGLRTVLELLVLKALGVDLVWTVHNRFDHEQKSPEVELVTRHLAARIVDRMTVHCEAARERVLESYRLPDRLAERITVVPHGHYRDAYPNEVSREAARRRLGYDDDETVFLFFGYVRPYKNVPELMSTFSELEREDARLLVVGKPWDEAMARKIRDPDDARIDTKTEFVDEDEVQWYMNAADAVVLPYEAVLTSGSAILAMSFDKPVIAPDIGCLGTLLEHGSISYDPEATDGLRRALEAALASDLAARGDRCAEFVERLEWDRSARKLRRLYE
jgi:glycosyltransferase involved in cell wall biosynthesis